jgi:hypothetical protein
MGGKNKKRKEFGIISLASYPSLVKCMQEFLVVWNWKTTLSELKKRIENGEKRL